MSNTDVKSVYTLNPTKAFLIYPSAQVEYLSTPTAGRKVPAVPAVFVQLTPALERGSGPLQAEAWSSLLHHQTVIRKLWISILLYHWVFGELGKATF